MNWEDFGLVDDPFSVVPSKEKIVWANRETFKGEVEDAIRRALLSTPSRIIACIWGEWGAGKTHAMNYFSNTEVIRQLISEFDLEIAKMPISIPIIFPLRNTLDTVYLEIVEQIGVDQIVEALDYLESKFESIRSREKYLQEVSKYVDPRVAEPLVTLKGKGKMTFERYLFMTATSAELRRAGIARGIQTTNDKVRTLSGILKLLTNTIASNVFIWFDDMERIADLPGRDVFDFQHFLRDLLDSIPNNMIIFFNMTLMPGENIEDRIGFLGDAIRYRISSRIVVEPLTKGEYHNYVKDLLAAYRPEKFTKDEYFPFEQDALKLILSGLENQPIPVTPRQVNKVLSAVLWLALSQKERTEPMITSEFVKEHIQDII